MRLPITIATLSLALAAGFVASARQVQSAKPQTARGLHTATFETAQGSVRVNLPDDMSAGDTISGTVLAEPLGQTDQERRKNSDELNGYVVEIQPSTAPVSGAPETARTRVEDKVLKWQVPVGAVARGVVPTATLILKDNTGRSVGKTEVPVLPTTQPPRTAGPTPGDFELPRIGQTGRPFQVSGPFDGDFSNTTVKLGGRDVEKLAESPRKLVAESPRDIVGPAELEVREGNTVVKGEYRNLAISLRAPKTTLLKSETTTLTVEVQGLKGLEENAPVTIENRSREVIDAEGGNLQALAIRPEDVSADGTFTLTRTLTGIRAGNFQIVATVMRPEAPDYSCCEKDIVVGQPVPIVKTSLVDNNTKRKVEIWMQFPIEFQCDKREEDTDCIGKVDVKLRDQPLQLHPGGGTFDVQPTRSSLQTDWVKGIKCDGKKHKGIVTSSWEAVYPGKDEVKGSLKLSLWVPDNKGKVNHIGSVDVSASSAGPKFGNPTLTPVPPQPPPYSCCESDITLSGASAVASKQTGMVNNNTRRAVRIQIQVPIAFKCATRKDTDCIGKLQVAITQAPEQLNPGNQRFEVPPVSSEARSDSVKKKCDGKDQKGIVTVFWDGEYIGSQQVKGTLKLRLTVPADKGKVNHALTLDVDAAGNNVDVKNVKLEEAK